MTSVLDDKLFEHTSRLKDKVVVITGAANGIGKETATQFAGYGAKIVIGDLDVAGARKTVEAIKSSGGDAVSIKCNVTIWDDQVAMYELAISQYGSVDIVVANAGVGELGTFEEVKLKDGKPIKPDTRTLDVNLTGVLYTAHLALHYLPLNRVVPGSLKAMVLIGSIASWQAIPRAALYSASKHAVLGLMRCLYIGFKANDMRIGCVHPFFVDTNIVPTAARIFLAGIPLASVNRVAGAIICAATNPDPETNGCAWLLADNGPVFMIPREIFKLGVYKLIDERTNALVQGLSGTVYYARIVGDLTRALGKPLFIAGLGVAVAKTSWEHRDTISGYLRALF